MDKAKDKVSSAMETAAGVKPYFGWVDLAKTIGIWLVIVAHGLLPEGPTQFVFAFHMPLFFLLSGFLYHPLTLGETLKKDVRSLVVPYLIINLISLIYSALVAPAVSLAWFGQRLGAIGMGLGYEVDGWIPVCTPSWFLAALFLLRIVLALGYRVRRYFYAVLPFVAVFIVIGLKHFGIDLLVPLDSALMAAPFFCAGYFLKSRFAHGSSARKGILIASAAFVATIVINHFNGRVSLNTCRFGHDVAAFYVAGFAGSVFLIALCKLLSCGGGKFVRTISQGTLLVIGFNLTAIRIAMKVWKVVFPNAGMGIGAGIIVGTLILLAFYPLILFCRKYIPAILGYRSADPSASICKGIASR